MIPESVFQVTPPPPNFCKKNKIKPFAPTRFVHLCENNLTRCKQHDHPITPITATRIERRPERSTHHKAIHLIIIIIPIHPIPSRSDISWLSGLATSQAPVATTTISAC